MDLLIFHFDFENFFRNIYSEIQLLHQIHFDMDYFSSNCSIFWNNQNYQSNSEKTVIFMVNQGVNHVTVTLS